MKRYNLLLIGALCLIGQCALSQISEGGSPVSFSLSTKISDVPVVTMPPVNTKALIQEDEKARMVKEDAPKPFRFGYAIDVDIDIKKAGVLKRLPDGDKLWVLKIQSADAYSINLIFNRFRLSEGSKFFIYNEDKTMVLGAFTPEVSNNSSDRFSTDLVQGNTIVLEYYEPESVDDGVINISKVIHGYVNTFSKGYGNSAYCNIDVNCPLGDEWENEKRAVSLILLNDNTSWCTGCLVNNTQQDLTPYFLTANHCLYRGGVLEDPNTWIFKFKYWRFVCNDYSSIAGGFSVRGATLLANYASSDFALLELNERPPSYYNVYYAGWDRTEDPVQNVTGIHHPQGDAMKISYKNASILSTSLVGSNELNHWDVIFDHGTVQPGSSGSPLFNQDYRIIGQLHNGDCEPYDSNCACDSKEGRYGRFDYSWEGGGTSSTRLKDWLDPLNTGVEVLDGRDCTASLTNQTINDTRTIVGCEVVVNNMTFNSNANVTITSHHKVEILSMVAEEGSSVIINNGTQTSQSSSSSSFSSLPGSRSLLDSGDIEEDVLDVETIAPDTQARLYQNIPNPFTGETVIGYYIPESAGSAYLRFMTATGVVAKAISLSAFGEGEVSISANELSAGVYFYTLVVDGQIVNSRQMVVGN